MEVSNKKITSPFFAFLFISCIFIQCFPYVSSIGVTPGNNLPLAKPVPKPEPAKPVPKPNPAKPNPTIPAQPLPTPAAPGGKKFCISKPSATDAQLQASLTWTCKEGGVDCGPVNAGGACSQPNTVRSRASFVMNSYYQMNGKNDQKCDFRGSATIVFADPSYGACKYLS